VPASAFPRHSGNFLARLRSLRPRLGAFHARKASQREFAFIVHAIVQTKSVTVLNSKSISEEGNRPRRVLPDNTVEPLGAQTRRQAQRRRNRKDPDGGQVEEVRKSRQRITRAKHYHQKRKYRENTCNFVTRCVCHRCFPPFATRTTRSINAVLRPFFPIANNALTLKKLPVLGNFWISHVNLSTSSTYLRRPGALANSAFGPAPATPSSPKCLHSPVYCPHRRMPLYLLPRSLARTAQRAK